MEAHSINIREGAPGDAPEILAMMRALGAELGTAEAVRVSEAELRRDGFGPQKKFEAMIAECSRQAVGMALHSTLYVPDQGRDSILVHQIYVQPKYRRRRVATALIANLARQAAENNTFVQLGTTPALPRTTFFESIGCQMATGYMTLLLFGDSLVQLAASAQDLLA